MSVIFKISGTLVFSSPARAKAAHATFQEQCWDFCEDLVVQDGKLLVLERITDVPHDGYENFDEAFIELSRTAKDGQLRLDWNPDSLGDFTTFGDLSKEFSPEEPLSHIIYPKRRCVVVTRLKKKPEEPFSSFELGYSYRREAKYAKRYYTPIRKSKVVITENDSLRAACVGMRHGMMEKFEALSGVALFDKDSRREKARLFATKLMFHHLAFSPDGSKLAAAASSGSSFGGKKTGACAIVWELSTGKATKLKSTAKKVSEVAWKDDKTLKSPQESWKLE